VFVLGSCSPIIGSDVRSFDTEQELLRAWAQFVNEVDPDMFTGYNIENFDFWYIIKRAEKLRVREINHISRLRNSPIRLVEKTFQSNAYGKRVSRTASIYGRIKFDALQIMQRDQKLSSYTLNHVSSTFLGQQKEDVHHSIISVLHNGTADDRRRLAVYCIKDAYLPQRLLDKLMCTINYIEMSRVTGVPFSYLLERGQQIKVLSQLYRRAQADALLIPTYKRQPPSSDVRAVGSDGDGGGDWFSFSAQH
jgi:DNA polymerase delta subunit 1